MAAVIAAALTPASKIIAIDLQDPKLDQARALGATVTINPGKQDLVKELFALTGNFGIDRAIDTTGNIGVINTMIASAAPGAIVASVGAPRMGAKVEIEPATWLVRGVSYTGVHQGSSIPQQFLPYLIQLWKDGRLPLEKLIKSYHYTDIERAKSDMEAGICIKAVLRWDTDE
ncbi:NAD/NADP dependent alcohol dehydrogenase [Hypocenomyce scalaris]|nr:NAD/NADP dependent alcohol dehydrogenase [Hypocenomyce scalaris]